MIKQGGAWREVDWNVALDYVAHGLKDVAREHGGDAVAALAAQSSTLEELYLLARGHEGPGSAATLISVRARCDFGTDGKRAGAPWLGLQPGRDQGSRRRTGGWQFPAQGPSAVRPAPASGCQAVDQVSLISVGGDDQLIKLHAQLAVAPADLAKTLAAVVKAVAEIKGVAIPAGLESAAGSEATRRIAQSLVDGEKRAIFLGNAATQSAQATQLHALAVELGTLTDATRRFHRRGAPTGSAAMSPRPCRPAPTLTRCSSSRARRMSCWASSRNSIAPTRNRRSLRSSRPLWSSCMTAFKHAPALDYADVLLPIAPFTETSGTFVNTEGRVQSFNGVVRPLGDARPAWKVLRVLGNVLNLDGFAYESSEAVRDEAIGKGTEFVAGLDNGLNGVAINLESAPAGGICSASPMCRSILPIRLRGAHRRSSRQPMRRRPRRA